MDQLHALWIRDREQILEDYLALLRFASIGAESVHDADTKACGQWVANHLRESGFAVEEWETPGHPTIFAERLQGSLDQPTVLLYGHYDVQPVDPLDEWISPPFQPRIDGKTIYARGAVDNKGQLMYVLAAVRALEGCPVNIKMCIEGDEETGSEGLEAILPKVKDRLKADYLAVVDSGIPARDTPAVTLGARGVATLTIELRGSKIDLHSGLFGGIALNPNHALIELLAKLRDSDGRILVPGFYDKVRELSKEERSALFLEFDEEESRSDFGVEPLGGESNYPPGESGTIRPTLEINGLHGGYGGPGFKTVIPAVAQAKLSCRLVPNQDPAVITRNVIEFLQQNLPKGITMTFTDHHGGPAAWSQYDSKGLQAMAQAYSDVYRKPCKLIMMGGSVPITATLANAAEAEPILCGVGLPTDDIHAPNEHFDLDRLEQGFYVISRFLGGLSC